MANEDILLKVGLDLTDFDKDVVGLKAKAQQLRTEFAKMPSAEIRARFGVGTKKELLGQFDKLISDLDREVRDNAAYQLTVGGLKTDKAAVKEFEKDNARILKGQEDAAKRGIDLEQKREDQARRTSAVRVAEEIRATKNQEKLRIKEDAIYNDYLAHQTAGVEKQKTEQDRIYNDYLSKQTAGIAKQRAQQDKLYNEYLAHQESSLGSSVTRSQALMQRLESPSLRYALYDISRNFTVIGLSATAAGVAVAAMAAKQESAMSDLERTTLADVRSIELLKYQFQELAQQIPLSMGELTSIGAIGAQMGIASSELSGFTKTVAQFSATTNVSMETAAQSFGTIGELLGISAEEYKNLGSAIALVGVRSNATESQILSVTTGIAGVAEQAGVSTEYVVGLAGTLASLGIPSEQARGALTRIFQQVNRSAAEGGQAFENFSNIVGMTSADLQAMLSSEGGMEQFFSKFTQGLSGLDAQSLTTTLDALGLADVRVTNVLARLSENTAFMTENLDNASEGFKNGTILAQLFANKSEDLAAKFQMLLNSLTELGAEIGTALLPILGTVVDWLSSSIQLLADFAATDFGRGFFQIALAITAVVGGLALLAGAFTAGTAALSAFAFALDSIGIQGGVKGLFSLAAGFIGVGTGAGAGAIALNVFKVALASTGIGLAVVALGTLASAFMSASLSADQAFKNMISDTSGLATALQSDAAAYQSALASGNQALIDSFTVVDVSGQAASDTSNEFSSSVENMYSALDKIPPALDGINNGFEDTTRVVGDATRQWVTNALLASSEFQDLFTNDKWAQWVDGINLDLGVLIDKQAAGATEDDLIKYLYGLQQTANANGPKVPVMLGAASNSFLEAGGNTDKLLKSIMGLSGAYYLAGTAADSMTKANNDAETGFEGVGNAADAAAEKIYTLVDYANDLSSIWDRAFDIRFSGGETLDKISSAFSKIAQATADAREEIQSLSADIQSLEADQALQKYFLTVAEAYGDTLKAQEIRANLAKIDADLTKKTKDLQKAQDKTNKSLVGNTDAAIDNRAEILDLIGGYQDHIKALAASGLNEDGLRAKTAQLKSEFMAQATQLGYNSDELGQYAAAFDDVTVAIDNVPRDITVTANTDPALQALNEFEAKMKELGGKSYSGGTIKAPTVDNNAARASAVQAHIEYLKGAVAEAVANKNYRAAQARDSDLATYLRALITGDYASVGYSDGGYTGVGGKYQPAGIVHKGEYVIPKDQVNQSTKIPYFMEQPRSFAQGGYVGQQSGGMVSLSPEDRALLRNVGGSGNIVLYADSKELARSVNDGNRQIVASGGRP